MNDASIERTVKALEQIALVLAALYGDRLGAITQGDKAERLSRLGFSNSQIADALGTSQNSVNVSRVTHRKKTGRPKARTRRKSEKAARKAKMRHPCEFACRSIHGGLS